MLIKSKRSWHLSENETVDESIYVNRRRFIQAIAAGAAISQTTIAQAAFGGLFGEEQPKASTELLTYQPQTSRPKLITDEQKAIQYNNFYEFGTSKTDPFDNAQTFKTDPWSIAIDGEVEKPTRVDIEQVLTHKDLQERIYRMRCVEAWSMVIPWVGLPLAELLKLVKPTSKAQFVAFETLYDPKQMPGQASRWIGGGIDYPYVEALRLDEAMHPLTILAVGMYGKTLPPQNGAPLRLVVPWKYGFKGIKSIVRIRLTEKRPSNTWNLLAPGEYGFYANVNPEVDHPRWSQSSERQIMSGGLFETQRVATKMFNGYGEEVAELYRGLDLARNY